MPGNAVAPKLQSMRLIGESEVFVSTIARAERCALSRHPIVIGGNTGTGKGMLARYIHDSSGLAGRFVHLNCSAIPEALLESELFGAERGAYTGAGSKNKSGFIELAAGGTLFLDEIGDMPMGLQVKLLTALDGEFYRVGGRQPLPFEARIVVATKMDLAVAVEKKTFREDLYYRLATFTLTMPELRERREDILPLVAFFCRKEKCEFEIGEDKQNATRLTLFPWPGNVRQLESVVKRVAVMKASPDRMLYPADLVGELPKATGDPRCSVGSATAFFSGAEFPKWEHYERSYLEALYARTEGNVTECGKLAGMQRKTIRYRLAKFGIHR